MDFNTKYRILYSNIGFGAVIWGIYTTYLCVCAVCMHVFLSNSTVSNPCPGGLFFSLSFLFLLRTHHVCVLLSSANKSPFHFIGLWLHSLQIFAEGRSRG